MAKKKNRVGETRTMNNGMKATIIAYRSYHDIDVLFENGYVKEGVHCLNFARGQVAYQGQDAQSVNRKAYRVKESKTMSNGMKATIIAYRSTGDIDVQFEDGVIKYNVTYSAFSQGKVAHPASSKHRSREANHVGETQIMNNGMSATIIACHSGTCVDIQFEDKTIKKNVSLSNFTKGKVAHPTGTRAIPRGAIRVKNRVGEVRKMHNGMIATIIAYRSCGDMDVQFENGQIREHVQYGAFTRGNIAPKALSKN